MLEDISDEQLLKNAKTFARTLIKKPFPEAIGQLHLAFDMDMISAKALMVIVALETNNDCLC